MRNCLRPNGKYSCVYDRLHLFILSFFPAPFIKPSSSFAVSRNDRLHFYIHIKSPPPIPHFILNHFQIAAIIQFSVPNMLLDSQPSIWWISIHSHEAKAFRLRRPCDPGIKELNKYKWRMQNCPGICNILAHIRSVQVKPSITEEEGATEVFAALRAWTAVGHTEQTWFHDSLGSQMAKCWTGVQRP